MDDITIRYITQDHTVKEEGFPPDSQHIRLKGRRIVDIDLAQFSQFPELVTINLSWNLLHRIDLAPLVDCKKLENLSFQKNEFEHIDLSPLSTMSTLSFIELEGNAFSSLDLSPVFRIPNPFVVVTFDEGTYIELDDEIRKWNPWDFDRKLSMVLREILMNYHG